MVQFWFNLDLLSLGPRILVLVTRLCSDSDPSSSESRPGLDRIWARLDLVLFFSAAKDFLVSSIFTNLKGNYQRFFTLPRRKKKQPEKVDQYCQASIQKVERSRATSSGHFSNMLKVLYIGDTISAICTALFSNQCSCLCHCFEIKFQLYFS